MFCMEYSVYEAKMWTPRNSQERILEVFETWTTRRRIEKISWILKMRNEKMPKREEEARKKKYLIQ